MTAHKDVGRLQGENWHFLPWWPVCSPPAALLEPPGRGGEAGRSGAEEGEVTDPGTCHLWLCRGQGASREAGRLPGREGSQQGRCGVACCCKTTSLCVCVRTRVRLCARVHKWLHPGSTGLPREASMCPKNMPAAAKAVTSVQLPALPSSGPFPPLRPGCPCTGEERGVPGLPSPHWAVGPDARLSGVGGRAPNGL